MSAYRREGDGLLLASVGDAFIAASDTTTEAEATFAVMVKQAEEAHAKTVTSLVARLDREIEDAQHEPPPVEPRHPIHWPSAVTEDFAGRLRPRADLCACEGGPSPQCDACVRNE